LYGHVETWRKGFRDPVIVATAMPDGYGDSPMSMQAMKRSATEFLTKPFRVQDFLEAIGVGLARSNYWR
jgi:FixJ family two-component response regulator